MTTTASLVWVFGLPFAGSFLPLAFARRGRTLIAWASAVGPIGALMILAGAAPSVFDGQAPSYSVPWVPALGLQFALRLDGWAWLFAALILVIGLLVILYGRYYLSADDPFGRFYALLLLFMGSMLGIAVSDNLLLLIFFWELTSLSSFLLIGYWNSRADARAGARMALAITGMGGLALLGGALVLQQMTGTLEISRLNEMGPEIRAHAWYPVALVLVLLGAFTKSAQFPFHFWLPNAMAAPTPVSAYLHSATMVKAGIFLLARLYPALSGTDEWFYAVGGAGLVTLVFGAWQATFRHDLKGLLAYSTISHLGLITLLLGLGSPLAPVAAVFHIINHATFKASLFMAAGIIDHETGTRDMRRLGGLWTFMPVTGALALVASAAMAGVPLLNGFLSKEMLFAESLALERGGFVAWLIPMAATAAGIFGVAYSSRFVHDVFFNGPPRDIDRTPHEPPRWMRIPVEVLVVLCVLVGILPQVSVGRLLDVASRAVLGAEPPAYSLAIWHGFNVPLLMSVIALAGGVALYFLLQSRALHAHVGGALTGHALFEKLIHALDRTSGAFTRATTDGTLQRQVAVTIAVVLVAGGAPMLAGLPVWTATASTPANPIAFVGWAVLVVATIAVVAAHRARLTALILTGAVGLIVSAVFAYYSAPDLALTQLVVEVAMTLLMLLSLGHLPAATPRESVTARRARDGVLAALCGLGLGAAAWWMMTRGGDSVSVEHAARSVPEGGGTNVVNVILVDFRGFDTFGEISVLVTAALGIVALLARPSDPVPVPVAEDDADREPALVMLSRIILPPALLVSVYIFLRGHNLPGGGFIAGLVSGVALALLGLGSGQGWRHRMVRIDFHKVTAAGLVIAAATGIGAWAFGQPFMTSAHGAVHLPLIGELHLATAALFDLGVYLVVVGVIMLVLDHLSAVRRREAA
jgi:multicomponent K+:H+ antiporter subunit A